MRFISLTGYGTKNEEFCINANHISVIEDMDNSAGTVIYLNGTTDYVRVNQTKEEIINMIRSAE